MVNLSCVLGYRLASPTVSMVGYRLDGVPVHFEKWDGAACRSVTGITTKGTAVGEPKACLQIKHNHGKLR